MVKDSARKKAARSHAQASGQRYTAANRRTAHPRAAGRVSAYELHTALSTALWEAGWPVEAEDFPENVEYRSYAGPARLTVGRGDQVTAFGGEDDPDPDDAARLDLSRPPRVQMAAPLAPTAHEVADDIAGDRPVAELIGRLGGMLADGRAAALAHAANDAGCAVCGDRHPQAHLLAAAGDDRLRVCPACAFDGDIFVTGPQATAYLAYQIDRLADRDLSAPAGWAGPAALLACLAPDGFSEALERQWREAGTLFVPSPFWSDPDLIWTWLPHPNRRPAWLAGFGPGARLGAVVTALDEARTDLRQRARAEQAEAWREAGGPYGDGDDEQPPDRFIEQVWPAAVAYAVSLTTQAAERPRHRPPLDHLLGSFDALPDHLRLMGSSVDFGDVESTISVGIEILTEELRT